MASGHHSLTAHDHARWLAEFKRFLAEPKFRAALEKYTAIEEDKDVPYVGGSDNAGRKVLFDVHFAEAVRAGKVLYKGRPFDPRPFIKIHEAVEGVLIRLYGLDYERAHLIATAAEREAVERAGLNWAVYSKAIEPFIRIDEHEKITNPPRDLLLEAYKGKGGSISNPMFKKLAGAQAAKAPDGNFYISDARRPGKYLRIDHDENEGDKDKVTKDSVNYRASSAEMRHCGICGMFEPHDTGNTCTLVKGPIDALYVCDRWERRKGNRLVEGR